MRKRKSKISTPPHSQDDISAVHMKRTRTMLDLIPDDVITTHILPCLDEVATLKARIAELKAEAEVEKKRSREQEERIWLRMERRENWWEDHCDDLKEQLEEEEEETRKWRKRHATEEEETRKWRKRHATVKYRLHSLQDIC